MQMKVRLVSVAVVALLCLVASGCGDGALSKSDYIAKNNAIQTKATASFGAISSLDPNKPAEAAAQVLLVKKDLDAAVVKLEALKPPSDWKDEHSSMVQAVKQTSAALGELSAAVKAQDANAIKQANTKLTTSNVSFRAAINAINNSR